MPTPRHVDVVECLDPDCAVCRQDAEAANRRTMERPLASWETELLAQPGTLVGEYDEMPMPTTEYDAFGNPRATVRRPVRRTPAAPTWQHNSEYVQPITYQPASLSQHVGLANGIYRAYHRADRYSDNRTCSIELYTIREGSIAGTRVIRRSNGQPFATLQADGGLWLWHRYQNGGLDNYQLAALEIFDNRGWILEAQQQDFPNYLSYMYRRSDLLVSSEIERTSCLICNTTTRAQGNPLCCPEHQNLVPRLPDSDITDPAAGGRVRNRQRVPALRSAINPDRIL